MLGRSSIRYMYQGFTDHPDQFVISYISTPKEPNGSGGQWIPNTWLDYDKIIKFVVPQL